jgi:hypothetical protein
MLILLPMLPLPPPLPPLLLLSLLLLIWLHVHSSKRQTHVLISVTTSSPCTRPSPMACSLI